MRQISVLEYAQSDANIYVPTRLGAVAPPNVGRLTLDLRALESAPSGHQREHLEQLGAEEDGRAVERRPRLAVVPQQVRELQVQLLAEIAPPRGAAPLENAAGCHMGLPKN